MTGESGPVAENKVTVVYCGGCNPHIDRTAVAAAVPEDDPDVRPGATLFLSGCPRACASQHLLTTRSGAAAGRSAGDAAPAGDDRVTVVVAGELVDGVPTPEDLLALTITRKLKE